MAVAPRGGRRRPPPPQGRVGRRSRAAAAPPPPAPPHLEDGPFRELLVTRSASRRGDGAADCLPASLASRARVRRGAHRLSLPDAPPGLRRGEAERPDSGGLTRAGASADPSLLRGGRGPHAGAPSVSAVLSILDDALVSPPALIPAPGSAAPATSTSHQQRSASPDTVADGWRAVEEDSGARLVRVSATARGPAPMERTGHRGRLRAAPKDWGDARAHHRHHRVREAAPGGLRRLWLDRGHRLRGAPGETRPLTLLGARSGLPDYGSFVLSTSRRITEFVVAAATASARAGLRLGWWSRERHVDAGPWPRAVGGPAGGGDGLAPARLAVSGVDASVPSAPVPVTRSQRSISRSPPIRSPCGGTCSPHAMRLLAAWAGLTLAARARFLSRARRATCSSPASRSPRRGGLGSTRSPWANRILRDGILLNTGRARAAPARPAIPVHDAPSFSRCRGTRPRRAMDRALARRLVGRFLAGPAAGGPRRGAAVNAGAGHRAHYLCETVRSAPNARRRRVYGERSTHLAERRAAHRRSAHPRARPRDGSAWPIRAGAGAGPRRRYLRLDAMCRARNRAHARPLERCTRRPRWVRHPCRPAPSDRISGAVPSWGTCGSARGRI